MNTRTGRPPFWQRNFPEGMGTGALLFATWSVSCAALLAALALYVLLTPGLAGSIAGGGPAGGYFLRQIVFNGLPVAFGLNLLGLALFARLAHRRPGLALGLDAVLRPALFIGLHAAIYPLAALGFGSFGGDPGQALAAIGPTLAETWRFGTISAAYFLAGAPGAVALFSAAFRTRRRWLLGAACSLWIAALAAATSAIAALLS